MSVSNFENPNAREDAPVVRQIVMVLVGFALMATTVAVVLNLVV